MKRRLLCLLLLLCCLAASCAAPAQPPAETSAAPTEQAEVPQALGPGLYELMCFDRFHGEYVQSVAAVDGKAVIFTCAWSEDTSVEHLYWVDLATGVCRPPVVLEGAPSPELNRIAFTANGALLLYNPYVDHALLYDGKGKLLDTLPCPVGTEDHRSWHPMVNDRFSYYDTCALYHSYKYGEAFMTALAFYDDMDALITTDACFSQLCAANGHVLLEADYGETGGAITYYRNDYDAGMQTDRLTLPAEPEEDVWYNATQSLLFDGGALLTVEEYRSEEESYEHVYLWIFSGEAPVPFRAQRMTEADFAAANERMIAETADRYEIEVLADVVPGSEISEEAQRFRDDYGCITGCTGFEIYELLLQLEDFLQTLPEGFTREMYTDYPAGWDGHDRFTIYIVAEIPGDPAAYAFHSAPDDFYICLATQEFSYSHLPHEFMHLIEARIFAEWEARGADFWSAWDELNPPDFWYDESEFDEDYFVSRYAMTNQMEDRAETFMTAYLSERPFSDSAWYAEYPQVAAKTDLLLAAIRDAYPSVQNAAEVFWEK